MPFFSSLSDAIAAAVALATETGARHIVYSMNHDYRVARDGSVLSMSGAPVAHVANPA